MTPGDNRVVDGNTAKIASLDAGDYGHSRNGDRPLHGVSAGSDEPWAKVNPCSRCETPAYCAARCRDHLGLTIAF